MLKIEKVTKTYKGGKTAVDCLSLTVNAGDIFGFIGHNGAGKTTTLKCVAGILDFDEGEIYVNGKSVKSQPIDCKKDIAYIPDNPELYDYLTGVQYLNFIADVYGVGKQEREDLIVRYADEFELTPWLGNLISAYSHGMKQKLAIISAFIHSPKLLILDEPFVGLDPKASLKLKELMKERCGNGGAIFFSTHVLEVAEKLCNKIAIIKDGKLIVSGDTKKLTAGNSLEELFMEVVDD